MHRTSVRTCTVRGLDRNGGTRLVALRCETMVVPPQVREPARPSCPIRRRASVRCCRAVPCRTVLCGRVGGLAGSGVRMRDRGMRDRGMRCGGIVRGRGGIVRGRASVRFDAASTCSCRRLDSPSASCLPHATSQLYSLPSLQCCVGSAGARACRCCHVGHTSQPKYNYRTKVHASSGCVCSNFAAPDYPGRKFGGMARLAENG